MNTLMPETQGPSLEDAPGLTEDELDQLVIDDYSQNEAICPKGGFLSRCLEYFRTVSEVSDASILGSLLPIFSACLSEKVRLKPNLWGNFRLTLYSLLAGSPGTGKSTLIRVVHKLAGEVLPKERFGTQHTSVEALFDTMDPEKGGNPDKLFIISEGNEVINGWSQNNSVNTAMGKKMLALHDADPWTMSFRKDAAQGNDTPMRKIECASANMLMGTTMNTAGFSRLSDRDGMRRRFLIFIIKESVRTIYYPQGGAETTKFKELCLNASVLGQIAGDVDMDDSAKTEWIRIQDDNRARLKMLNVLTGGQSAAIEATLVSTEPSHIMKVATIFACCELIDPYVTSYSSYDSYGVPLDREKSRDAPILTSKHIKYAEKFIKQCTYNALQLDRVADKDTIQEEFLQIEAKVFNNHYKFDSGVDIGSDGQRGFCVSLSKGGLTRLISASGDRSSISSDRLHNVIMPEMHKQHRCDISEKDNFIRYTFFYADPPKHYKESEECLRG